MGQRAKQACQHLTASGRIEADFTTSQGAGNHRVFAWGGLVDLDPKRIQRFGQA
jgi:hypothetical protein